MVPCNHSANHAGAEIPPLARRKLDPQPAEKILGFGTGANLLLVKEKCPDADLRGLDIDPKVQAIAHRKLVKHRLYIPLDLYDGEIFPYTTARFDKVYSCLVFH